VSGIYVLVYLGRWEWNRATMAGFVFLSALVTVSTALVLRRVGALERRLADRSPPPPDASVVEALHEANQPTTQRFEWLRPDANRLSVFVPVLLGAGTLLSMVAYVVERIAGALAGATLDRRTAAAVPLDLPLGGGAMAVPQVPRRPLDPRRARRRAALAVALLLVLGGLGVEAIRRMTQTVPGSLVEPGTTTLTVEVASKNRRPPDEVVVALWTVCGARVSGDLVVTSLGVEGDRVKLTIDKALRSTAAKRVVGCFEDLTLDRVQAEVIELTVEPTRASAP
jgi:hypothetical protein